jgi:16S rRNA (uracil1498-N3)-methyltransferase
MTVARRAYGIIAPDAGVHALTRLYFPGDIADHGECRVTAGQAHHVMHVLRLPVGAPLTLFDGRGVEFPALIKRIDKSGLTLTVTGRNAVSRESPLDILLAQGISSGERMDYTVQKCVELGVTAIQPLMTQRSVVRLTAERAERRVAHWQSVTAAACEQCGRNVLPVVLPPLSLMKWLGEPVPANSVRFLLSPYAAATPLRDRHRPLGRVTLLVGPEGGWSDDEIEAALSSGFLPLALGPRVLRTETAAVAALAALQALWGDA